MTRICYILWLIVLGWGVRLAVAEELPPAPPAGDPPPVGSLATDSNHVPQISSMRWTSMGTNYNTAVILPDGSNPEGRVPPPDDSGYMDAKGHFVKHKAIDPVYTITVYDKLSDTNNVMVEITKSGDQGYYKAELITK